MYYFLLAILLLMITIIDIKKYIIPNKLIILGVIIAIFFNLFFRIINIKDMILGSTICGGGMLIFTYIVEFIVKKEVMGGGDIKLFAMLGLFLGLKGTIITMILSIYVGAIYGILVILKSKIKREKYNSIIPYGPFISIAAWVYMFYGEQIIKFL
jgi:leader peptidase (prepilin peptidase)/N-methyltransferase